MGKVLGQAWRGCRLLVNAKPYGRDMSEPTPPATKPTPWRRAVRPLVWWSIMVLLMFAYRTHERLSASTRLTFEPVLAGKNVSFETETTLDGLGVSSGQRLTIGWHTLRLTHPKTRSFSTNLFIWYGENELGQIALERSAGKLVINANPAASRLTIQGPEFSLTLTNTPGITSAVPADRYVVQATYRYWNRRDEVVVAPDQNVVQKFAPQLGALRVESSHEDVTYLLLNSNSKVIEVGALPVSLNELPEGNYQLRATRKSEQRELPLTIKSGVTNKVKVEFLYGAVVLETDPSGASVTSEGHDYGLTPLTLPELKPGEREFTVRLSDYEPVTTALTVVANQTNSFHTNLVSRFFSEAMTRAQRYYEAKDYEAAAEAATEALTHKPEDEFGERLQRTATGLGHLVRAEALGKREEYGEAIKQLNLVQETMPDSASAKTLLADYSKREQERIATENKRQAELAAAERIRREQEQAEQQARQKTSQINQSFNLLSRTYENTGAFNTQDLIVSNAVGVVATAINNALTSGQPVFQVIHYDWPHGDTFSIQARQRIGMEYRECLIVGGQLQTNETKVFFKVLEYDHPPDLKLLNGLLNVSGSIGITSSDPKAATERAERFQARVKEGVAVVRGRIHAID